MSDWKTPDQIIRLQRLKQRTKALNARIDGTSLKSASAKGTTAKSAAVDDGPSKRKNPFAKGTDSNPNKRSRTSADPPPQPDNTNDDSIFKLLASEQQRPPRTSNQENDTKPSSSTSPNSHPLHATTTACTTSIPSSTSFLNLIAPEITAADDEANHQTPTAHVPIDWSLKTKIRLLTLSPLTGTGLKTCQEASGITSFVRCMHSSASAAKGSLATATSNSGLDSSLGARFHQATMHWQHPHLPWLQLFPRNARANADFTVGAAEREALAKDWTNSFRALFQLLRARQCAYFYVCANSYTVLFCAAGIGGRDEHHAYVTPTTRGMRDILKEEEIVFGMPLKALPGQKNANSSHNRSLDSGVETTQSAPGSSSFSNGSDEEKPVAGDDGDASDEEEEEEDQDEWLASMGVDEAEIRKIGAIGARATRNNECVDDFSDHSLALIEGFECQAFFNYLLSSKNTITRTGRLAGVPPTLLAPVAFPGATLRTMETRASRIRMDGEEYHSLELKGVVLPHVLPYLCGLMRESKDTFSASLTGNAGTNAFSRAAQRLMEDVPSSDNVFGRENLSDCGLPAAILEAMCRTGGDAVRCLERMCFNKEVGGYTWN